MDFVILTFFLIFLEIHSASVRDDNSFDKSRFHHEFEDAQEVVKRDGLNRQVLTQQLGKGKNNKNRVELYKDYIKDEGEVFKNDPISFYIPYDKARMVRRDIFGRRKLSNQPKDLQLKNTVSKKEAILEETKVPEEKIVIHDPEISKKSEIISNDERAPILEEELKEKEKPDTVLKPIIFNENDKNQSIEDESFMSENEENEEKDEYDDKEENDIVDLKKYIKAMEKEIKKEEIIEIDEKDNQKNKTEKSGNPKSDENRKIIDIKIDYELLKSKIANFFKEASEFCNFTQKVGIAN